MSELEGLLAPPLWLRWRLHEAEQRVAVLDPHGEIVLVATTRPAAVRRTVLGGALRLLATTDGLRLDEHFDWQIARPRGAAPLATITRTEAPRSVRSLLDASYELIAGDTPVGSLDRGLRTGARTIQAAGGARLTYRPVSGSGDWRFTGAEVCDDGGVLVRLVPGRADEVAHLAPRDGVVEALDGAVLAASGTPWTTVALALAACLLDSQYRDSTTPGTNERRPASRAPAGVSLGDAREVEKRRGRADRHDQKLDRLQQIARRRGNDELAERLEQRRRDRT